MVAMTKKQQVAMEAMRQLNADGIPYASEDGLTTHTGEKIDGRTMGPLVEKGLLRVMYALTQDGMRAAEDDE